MIIKEKEKLHDYKRKWKRSRERVVQNFNLRFHCRIVPKNCEHQHIQYQESVPRFSKEGSNQWYLQWNLYRSHPQGLTGENSEWLLINKRLLSKFYWTNSSPRYFLIPICSVFGRTIFYACFVANDLYMNGRVKKEKSLVLKLNLEKSLERLSRVFWTPFLKQKVFMVDGGNGFRRAYLGKVLYYYNSKSRGKFKASSIFVKGILALLSYSFLRFINGSRVFLRLYKYIRKQVPYKMGVQPLKKKQMQVNNAKV